MYFASAVEESHHGHEEHAEFHDTENPAAKAIV
jgi:hypothetical protein